MVERSDEPTLDLGNPVRPERLLTLLCPGHVFAGRYEVLAFVGRGGSGEVHRVWDRVAEAELALKVLYPGSHAASPERVRRELRLLREIRDPGIVALHDIGEHEGLLYLVMELLEGETLAERLRSSSPLPAPEAERIVRAVLASLEVAHASGIVHRDIKPANVMLEPTPTGGERVVLLDFGLARERSASGMTTTGRFLGTPQYAAPEQILGEALGPPADIYATGVLLWEMLAGAPPYTGESEIAVLKAQLEEPLPPTKRALSRTPARLRAAALALLTREPEGRPQSAADALALLARGARGRLAAAALRRSVTRAKSIRGLIALAAAFCGLVCGAWWALTPASVHGEGQHVVWRTRAGLEFRSSEQPLPVRDATLDPARGGIFPVTWAALDLPRPSPIPTREDLVALESTYPIRRFVWPWGQGNAARTRFTARVFYAHLYESRQQRLETQRIMALPPGALNDAELLLYLDAGPEFPGQMTLLAKHSEGCVLHPGHLVSFFHYLNPKDESRWLVATGFNNRIGPRPILLGIPPSVLTRGQSPPFLGSLHRYPASPGWYTPLPYLSSAHTAWLSADGSMGTAIIAEELSLRFDPSTGVPLDAKDRSGLDETSWQRSRDGLIAALFEASTLEQAGRPEEAGLALERYTREFAEVPHFLAIAQQRAATLFMQGEAPDYDRAITAIEAAIEAEEKPPRQRLLRTELLVRGGRLDEAREEIQLWARFPHEEMLGFEYYLLERLAGGALILPQLRELRTPTTGSAWVPLIEMAEAYAQGAPEQVIRLYEQRLEGAVRWDVHRMFAARALLESREDAGAALDIFRDMDGVNPLECRAPLESLRARIEVALGLETPHLALRRPAVESELTSLERHAPTRIECLYFLDMVREDLALLAEAAGETKRAARWRAELAASPW